MSELDPKKVRIIAKILGKLFSNKKVRVALLITLGVLVVAGGTTGGIIYGTGLKKAGETERLIGSLPTKIEDYAEYEEVIEKAYSAYKNLSGWQQKKVVNRDILLKFIPAYNQYKVEDLRFLLEELTVETVASTTILSDIALLYKTFNSEQKSLLKAEEIFQYDSYQRVDQLVRDIKEIQTDLVNQYKNIRRVKEEYESLAEPYKPFVYNYALTEDFDEQYSFLQKFTFTEIDGGYSVKAKEDVEFEGSITIPEYYGGKEVIKIEESGFAGQSKIMSITVPQTVQIVEKGAFVGCNRIETLTLPFTGKDINSTEKFSFIFGDKGVPQSLKTVKITQKDRVENNVFAGCNYIEKVFYSKPLEYLGANAFDGCEALLSLNSEEEGTLNLAGEMDAVGDCAFRNCQSIKKIVFSEEILTIGKSAFGFCRSIETLTLTNRITTIGDYAFEGLKKITEVTVHDSTQTIGVGAFKGCTALEEMTLPFIGKNKQHDKYHSVFGYIFGYEKGGHTSTVWDSGFKNEIFADSVWGGAGKPILDNGAIWQYSYAHGNIHRTSFWFYIPMTLRKITITNQTDIPTAGFNGCSMLTDITFTKGINSQGECAFQNCNATVHAVMDEES